MEITQTLPLYQESELLSFYRSGFESSELGRLYHLFPFSAIAESFGLKSGDVGHKSFFSPECKIALMVLKSYTGLSDRKLIEQINGILYTGFVRKGKKARDEDQRSKLRSLLSKGRSTRLEGSFGTEKEHYNLRKVKARTEQTEILWILFGVHTANAVRLAGRQQRKEQNKAA